MKDKIKKSLHLLFLLAKCELPQILVPPMNSSVSMPIKQTEIELHLVTEKMTLLNSPFSQSVFTQAPSCSMVCGPCAHPSDVPHPRLDPKFLQRTQNKVLLGKHKDDFPKSFHYSNKPVRAITPLLRKRTWQEPLVFCFGFVFVMKGGELKPKSKVTPKETAFLIKNLRGAKTLASISFLGTNKKKFSHHSFKGLIKWIKP